MYAAMTQTQRERFEEELELDFSYAIPGIARFRVNVSPAAGEPRRRLPGHPGRDQAVAGSGDPRGGRELRRAAPGFRVGHRSHRLRKPTTLAALVDLANRTPSRSHHDRRGSHRVPARAQAVPGQPARGRGRHHLVPPGAQARVAPGSDIILVGEMRDWRRSRSPSPRPDRALVFATLHTQDAAQTIDRIIDVFPAPSAATGTTAGGRHSQGVVCQTLCKTADGRSRAVATEVMVATPAIRNLIREGRDPPDLLRYAGLAPSSACTPSTSISRVLSRPT